MIHQFQRASARGTKLLRLGAVALLHFVTGCSPDAAGDTVTGPTPPTSNATPHAPPLLATVLDAAPMVPLVTTLLVAGHAPLGFRALTSLTCSVVAEIGWHVQLTGGTFRSVSDPTSPDATPGVCEITYPLGFVDGRAPATYWTAVSGITDLYVQYWSKLSANFVGHPVGFKQMIAKTRSGWLLFPRLVGTGLTAGFTSEVPGGTNTAFAAARVPVTRSVWHLNEMLLTGQGHLTYWLDGKLIVDANAPGWKPSPWAELQWRPIEGGNMGWKTPAAQSEQIDGVVVLGK